MKDRHIKHGLFRPSHAMTVLAVVTVFVLAAIWYSHQPNSGLQAELEKSTNMIAADKKNISF